MKGPVNLVIRETTSNRKKVLEDVMEEDHKDKSILSINENESNLSDD
jgi:hypothetical protein